MDPGNKMTSSIDKAFDANIGSSSSNFGQVMETQQQIIEQNKMTMADLNSAVEDLIIMAQTDGPLWVLGKDDTFDLNLTEYSGVLGKRARPSPMVTRHEASKETTFVAMSSNNLVNILMDAEQYSSVFSGIVARATTLHVLCAGDQETCLGALHLVNAEFQVLSPLVQNREGCFWRYCWKTFEGATIVVDYSLDHSWQTNNSSMRCRRKPSGCLIEDTHDGRSKVTWVEHFEVDGQERWNMYTPLIHSGLAFGAKRWISILKRHCKHLAKVVEQPSLDTFMEGKRGMLNLARRMVVSFQNGLSSSAAQPWKLLAANDDAYEIQFMVRKSIGDPVHPTGTILIGAVSCWLPFQHDSIFSYLQDHRNLHEWDICSVGHAVEEIAYILDGVKEWKHMSLLGYFIPGDTENSYKDVILQENYSDQIGSFVTYAMVNVDSIKSVLAGGEPNDVNLLPYGFAIYPNASLTHPSNSGSLLTLSFQLLLCSTTDHDILYDLIKLAKTRVLSTIGKIKSLMQARNL